MGRLPKEVFVLPGPVVLPVLNFVMMMVLILLNLMKKNENIVNVWGILDCTQTFLEQEELCLKLMKRFHLAQIHVIELKRTNDLSILTAVLITVTFGLSMSHVIMNCVRVKVSPNNAAIMIQIQCETTI